MDEDEDLTLGHAPSVRIRRIDMLILAAGFIRGAAELIHNTAQELEQLLAMHANYMTDQDDFADEVRRDLESIDTQEE